MGVRFMKKFSYFILTTIIVTVILCISFSKNLNLSKNAYSVPSLNANRLETSIENSNTKMDNGSSDIASIRNDSPDTPSVFKNKIDLNKIEKSNIINIVFFGLDGGSIKEYSRSDSIMVVSIDDKKNKIKVTSLMRDMYLQIPGKGNNRINAAYAFGGASLAIKTINTNFGLNISDYVTVDFKGLEKLIDYLGGVNINISREEADVLNTNVWEDSGLTEDKIQKVDSGLQNLNGRQTVTYCRIRYIGRADYERTERQRKVLNEILRKLKKNGIIKLPKTISTILPYVKTSLSAGEVLKLGLKGISLKTDNIEQYRLPVDGTYKSQKIRGMAVLVPNIEENKKKLYEFLYDIK